MKTGFKNFRENYSNSRYKHIQNLWKCAKTNKTNERE